MAPVVRTQSLSMRWGDVHALRDLTVDIEPGITGLLGANGAGKTTLIGLVLGLYPASSGTIEVFGQDPATFGPQIRSRLGYSPEHDVFPEDAQAMHLVRHLAELHGLPRSAATARAAEVLDLVGLGEERLRAVGTMSLGQKQRVKIAQSIAHDPSLVLLDEPTNGLDPVQRDDMLATIRRVGRELGIHVVISSHLIGEVERVCDHVVVLDAGTLNAAGPVDQMTLDTSGAWELEVTGGTPAGDVALAEALRGAALGADVVAAGRLLLQLPDAEAALDRVRDVLAAEGAAVRRLRRRHVSLEERFFDASDLLDADGAPNAPPAPGNEWAPR